MPVVPSITIESDRITAARQVFRLSHICPLTVQDSSLPLPVRDTHRGSDGRRSRAPFASVLLVEHRCPHPSTVLSETVSPASAVPFRPSLQRF
ncbi:hypothetical protein TNCV_1663011 [Trichonephila clavipes]|nr:hypothetical protein TNCV_1663011 [Trichonephila clavipes]